mgnify:CR=1 FL=1
MFTGIVKTRGTVQTVQRRGDGLDLTVSAPSVVNDQLLIGASVAVNGTCLTVTAKQADAFTANVMAESIRRTNLGQLRPGQLVNVEPALTLSTGLGGHLVLGHVDYCGRLLRRMVTPSALRLWISLPTAYQSLVVEKGSVAVDGVSLTVVAVTATNFEIDLIPHSQAVTTLRHLTVGAPLNVETDILGKYVARMTGTGELTK